MRILSWCLICLTALCGWPGVVWPEQQQVSSVNSAAQNSDTEGTETKTSGVSAVEQQNNNKDVKERRSFSPSQKIDLPEMSQPDIGTGLIQVTIGLFVVLLIIAAAAWITRRFGHFQGTAGGALSIIGGLHLSSREKLLVVQVGEEQLLLGVAPGRVSTLHVLKKPLAKTGDPLQVSPKFLDKLNAAIKRTNR